MYVGQVGFDKFHKDKPKRFRSNRDESGVGMDNSTHSPSDNYNSLPAGNDYDDEEYGLDD
jgi:hypothetical protein